MDEWKSLQELFAQQMLIYLTKEDGLKMKVIIYGIEYTKIRLQVEKELGNANEVVGYIIDESEGSKGIQSLYEYRQIISIHQMNEYLYDVIILLAQDYDENNRKLNLLLNHNVERSKILEYYWFGIYGGGISFRNPLRDFYELYHLRFDTWIFGMSYAVRGIYVHYLNDMAYKFCSPGMDLHYHLSCIKDLIGNEVLKPSRIILELPYYIFNYDLSLTKKNKVRMFSLYEDFDDWHNFGKQENDENYLFQYRMFERLFREKRKRCSGVYSNNIEVYPVKYLNVSEIGMDSFHNFHMWSDIHEETIKENRKLLRDLIQIVAEWDSNIEMIVLVMPHSKYEEIYYADDVMNMKDIYYDFFAKCDYCKVVDCFHLFDNHDEYFMDVEHLNTNGGIEFTKILQSIMKSAEDTGLSISIN